MAKQKIRGANIRIADGGYTVEVDYEMERHEDGKTCEMAWEPSKPRVFTDMDTMFGELKTLLSNKGAGTINLGKRRVPVTTED